MCNTFKQPPEAASQIYVPAVPAVKTPVGAAAKTHKIAFMGEVLHIYGRVA